MSAADQIKGFSQLTQRQIRSSGARALNRAATSARAEAARQIQDGLGALRIGDIKNLIVIDRASAREDLATMKAVLVMSRRQTRLYLFGARERRVSTPRGPRIGVTVKVKATRKLVAHAFIATTKTGHVGIFVRTGDSRFPIRELFSTSPADMLKNADIRGAVSAYASEQVQKNFAAEIAYQLSKGTAG